MLSAPTHAFRTYTCFPYSHMIPGAFPAPLLWVVVTSALAFREIAA